MSDPDPAVPRVASPNLSTAAMSVNSNPDRVIPRKQVVSWAMWDWATQPFNSVLLTFVFVPLYLVSANFLPADVAAQNADDSLVCSGGADAATAYCGGLADLSEAYGWATFLAGILILVLAPVLGQRADVAGNKKRWVVGATAVLALIQFSLFFVSSDPVFFWFGAAAIALGAVTAEIAGVNYNAMLVEVSTPRTVGRVSGLGWGLGYIGGIVALVLVVALNALDWFGLYVERPRVSPDRRRVRGVDRRVRHPVRAQRARSTGPRGPQADRLLRELWPPRSRHRGAVPRAPAHVLVPHRERHLPRWAGRRVRVRRGARGRDLRIHPGEVIVFAIAANVVAGIATISSGALDDRFGAKPLIVVSLVGLIISGLCVFFFHAGGPIVFWIFGLILCLFVGPAQSASRTFLARVTRRA